MLLKAFDESSLYLDGTLFNDQSIKIKYDPNYKDSIQQENTSIVARGKITWMKDANSNEANFDFLDYTDSEGNPLATLHNVEGTLYKSIFPTDSYSNKLITHDLKGTVLVNGVVDDTDTYVVDFQFDDTATSRMGMYDNIIECFGLTITPECTNFYNNKTGLVTNLTVLTDITNSTFKDITDCVFNSNFSNVEFKNLTNCIFDSGFISNVICYSDINEYTTSPDNDSLLYNENKYKKVYFEDGVLHVYCDKEHYFQRGMIMMHSGFEIPPDGWAVCDGGTYTYNGITSVTPNLVNKFIKAVDYSENVGEVLNPDLTSNNDFTLEKRHLPEHSHPHQEHTHTISGTSVVIENSGDLTSGTQKTQFNNVIPQPTSIISTITDENITSKSTDVVGSVTNEPEDGTSDVSLTGENHTHSITVTEGTISNSTSKESSQTWEN